MKRLPIVALLAIALLATIPPAAGQDMPPQDRGKSARQLLNDGNDHRTRGKYDLAITYYGYAIAKAQNDAKLPEPEKQSIIVKAIYNQALCNEEMDPPQVDQALTLYRRIVTEYPDVPAADLGPMPPARKLELKGIDIHLNYYRKQVTGIENIEVIRKLEGDFRNKITALSPDTDAIPGLLHAFGSPEPRVRELAADELWRVIDKDGIAATIAKLQEPSIDVVNAAQKAISHVIDRYLEAQQLDDQAEQIEAGMKPLESVPSEYNKSQIVLAEAKKLRDKAETLRHNIPADLGSQEIVMNSVETLLTGSFDANRKKYAAFVVEKIGEASPKVESALIKNFEEKNANIRVACAKALSAIRSKQALPKMHEFLVYEPEKVRASSPPNTPVDESNNEIVRMTIASALGEIDSATSIPPLIKALDDDRESVRAAAIAALMFIADTKDQMEIVKAKEMAYRADALPAERQKQIELWQKWWDETRCVAPLVDRFALFALKWIDFSAADIFSPETFLRNVKRRIRDRQENEDAFLRAEKVVAIFNKMKTPYKESLFELKDDAIPHLLKMLGGEIPRTNMKPEPAVARFVAEILAETAVRDDKKDLIATLQKIAGGGDGASPARRTGAIFALSRLPKESITPAIVSVIEGGLSSSNPDMVVVATECLSALKSTGSLARLSDALLTSPDNDKVRLIVIQAITDLGQKEKTAVGNLSSLAINPKSTPVIVEHALTALGTTGDIDALPAIIVCRISAHETVSRASAEAVKNLPKDQAVKKLDEALKDPKDSVRRSAAALLGDLEEQSVAGTLVRILIDVKPPREKKDPETRVRRAAAEALGRIKPQSKKVVEALIKAMEDEDDKVRSLAHQAIIAITGEDKIEFKPKDNESDRIKQIKKWREWYNNNAGNLFKNKPQEKTPS